MHKSFVILTVAQASELRKHIVSPLHSQWLKRRVESPVDLRKLGLSEEQVEAVNEAIAPALLEQKNS